MTNEPAPGIELNGSKASIVHRKGGEGRKVDNCVVDSRIICTGQKSRTVVPTEFFKFYFIYLLI